MSMLEEYDAAPDEAKTVLVQTWIRTRWREWFAELRAARPILVTPKPVVVVLDDDVSEVLTRDDVFSVAMYRSRMDPVVEGGFMLARDGALENWRDRGLLQALLTPGDLPRVRALAGDLADAALDRAEERGALDAVPELGRHVPIRLCADYFGIRDADETTVAGWSRAMQTDMFKNPRLDEGLHEASVKAGAELRDHLRALVAARRAEQRDGDTGPDDSPADVLGRLLATRLPAAVGFDDDRVVANVLGLLVGTVETTSQAVVHALEQLLTRPDARAESVRLARAGNAAEFDPYVWEALRHNPVNPLLPRMCERDHVLGAGTDRATLVPAGTLVLACTASALHDERAVPDPEAFRVDRPSPTRLHFGLGPHSCLGRHLGEQVVPEVVRRALLRPGLHLLPGAQSAVDFSAGPFPEHFWLGLREDPRAAS